MKNKFALPFVVLSLVIVLAFALKPGRAAQPDGEVVLALMPASATFSVGETFTVTIEVQAGEQPIDGVEAYLDFDPNAFEVSSLTAGDHLSLQLLNTFDNTSGEINFAAGTLNNFPTGTFSVATVTLTALTELENTSLTFVTTSARQSDVTFGGASVLDHTQDGVFNISTITSTPSPTATNSNPTSTPSPSATSSPNPTTTPSASATSSSNPTTTPSASATSSPNATSTPSATATSSSNATSTPSASATSSPNATSTPSASATSSSNPTSTPSATATSSPNATSTPSASATSSPNATSTPSASATSSPNATSTPSASATSSPNATRTPSATATSSPNATSTPSATATNSSATSTPSPTATTSTPIESDQDGDGAGDQIEDGAPNNGDANHDGTPDSEQSHVTSLPAVSENNNYVTLLSPEGTTLVDVQANLPSDETSNQFKLALGVFDFSVSGLSAGEAITVALILHANDIDTPRSYWKYGQTSDNPTAHWYDFTYDGTTGAVINDNTITLHFVDGQRGDADLTANGQIVDPGAPAWETQSQTKLFLPLLQR